MRKFGLFGFALASLMFTSHSHAKVLETYASAVDFRDERDESGSWYCKVLYKGKEHCAIVNSRCTKERKVKTEAERLERDLMINIQGGCTVVMAPAPEDPAFKEYRAKIADLESRLALCAKKNKELQLSPEAAHRGKGNKKVTDQIENAQAIVSKSSKSSNSSSAASADGDTGPSRR